MEREVRDPAPHAAWLGFLLIPVGILAYANSFSGTFLFDVHQVCQGKINFNGTDHKGDVVLRFSSKVFMDSKPGLIEFRQGSQRLDFRFQGVSVIASNNDGWDTLSGLYVLLCPKVADRTHDVLEGGEIPDAILLPAIRISCGRPWGNNQGFWPDVILRDKGI